MKKTSNSFFFMLMALLACCMLSSCSSDDDNDLEDNNTASTSTVSVQTLAAIKATFPSARLDSIKGCKEYDNIKLKYNGDLLISFVECYDDGAVHDGESYDLEWSRDTIYIRHRGGTMRAVIGDNGCIKTLILPNGMENSYTYDNNQHLIRYDYTDYDQSYVELTWENDNVVQKHRAKEQTNSTTGNETNTWSYQDSYLIYNTESNIGGFIGTIRGIAGSLFNFSSEYANGDYCTNWVLYYAGVLGKSTANLPISKNYSTGDNWYYEYEFDDTGFIKSAEENNYEPPRFGYEREYYFYR